MRKRSVGNHRLVITADEIWQARKPKYNGFACGHGAHKNKKKYDRGVEKERLRRELNQLTRKADRRESTSCSCLPCH